MSSSRRPRERLDVDADYPLLTVALTLSKSAIPGQSFPVTLNPSASVWDDLLGAPIAFEFQQGKITVGGSVSITNVVPGGGTLPGGATFSIFGTGFTPQTKVSLRGINASNIQYVSPTQFLVTLRETGTLDGALITVQNPDNSIDTYYSYMRGVPVGQSTRPLLAQTTPVFSIATANEAILPPTISSQVNADYFTALALQNPNAATASVTVEAHCGKRRPDRQPGSDAAFRSANFARGVRMVRRHIAYRRLSACGFGPTGAGVGIAG